MPLVAGATPARPEPGQEDDLMRRSCIISLVVVSVLLGGCESMGTRGQGTLIGAGAGVMYNA